MTDARLLRSECTSGHPFDGLTRTGKRFCRTCRGNRDRERDARLGKEGRAAEWARYIQSAQTPEQRRKRTENTKRWQAAHPEQAAAADRRRKLRLLGTTPEEWDRLFALQGGVCAICGQPETEILRGKVRRLAADHDHLSGKARGLLCHHCNLGLGRFRDDPSLLLAAIQYLEEYRV